MRHGEKRTERNGRERENRGGRGRGEFFPPRILYCFHRFFLPATFLVGEAREYEGAASLSRRRGWRPLKRKREGKRECEIEGDLIFLKNT